MTKKIYYLENLGCAHCAAKIQDRIERMPQVETVSLVFATRQLHVTAEDPDALFPEIQKIVSNIEPGASVSAQRPGERSRQEHHHDHCDCGHEHHHDHCDCGHEHHHDHCDCGHEHHHDHCDCDHEHHHDHCDCGHEHHHDHCDCGHEHHHDHEAHGHEHHQEAAHPHHRTHEGADSLTPLFAGAGLFLVGVLLSKWEIPRLIVFVAAYLTLGLPVLKTALLNLFRGHVFDENFLMSIATLGAFVIGEAPEAVGIMLFFRIGEAFEDRAVKRSRKQIMDAVDLRPETVTLAESGKVIDAQDARIGDLLLVRAGDRIPLDGTVISGESRIDTAPITGESVPVAVRPGDPVTSGCINTSGLLKIRVEKTLEQSMVTKILEAVESASASKPKIDRFIGKFARVYTPIVVALALATAVIPSLITGNWNYWVYTALSFLVMSCPCALVLSVPLAFFSGIGVGSKKGILFKGGLSMEAMADVKVVALDKTGTITKGNFVLQRTEGPEELLSLCASCEQNSSHPIAQSIVEAAKAQNLTLQTPDSLQEIPGHGIHAQLGGKSILCGSRSLMEKYQVEVPQLPATGGTLVLVARDGQYLGFLEVADTLKPTTVSTVQQLKAMGITPVLVTGDGETPARAMAEQAGIQTVYAGLLPQDKLHVLQTLRQEKGPIMFVGDGINDAPVLAGADVGAAMGSGADAAIEAADVVFMTSQLDAVTEALRISAQTRRIAWQNVIFALAVKIIVMILGLLGYANMWLAVFADSGVAMLCVLNSIRILYKK